MHFFHLIGGRHFKGTARLCNFWPHTISGLQLPNDSLSFRLPHVWKDEAINFFFFNVTKSSWMT